MSPVLHIVNVGTAATESYANINVGSQYSAVTCLINTVGLFNWPFCRISNSNFIECW